MTPERLEVVASSVSNRLMFQFSGKHPQLQGCQHFFGGPYVKTERHWVDFGSRFWWYILIYLMLFQMLSGDCGNARRSFVASSCPTSTLPLKSTFSRSSCQSEAVDLTFKKSDGTRTWQIVERWRGADGKLHSKPINHLTRGGWDTHIQIRKMSSCQCCSALSSMLKTYRVPW